MTKYHSAVAYRKKPLSIEAVQFDPRPFGQPDRDGSYHYRLAFGGGLYQTSIRVMVDETGTYGTIRTLEGDMRANPGDYILRGIAGEFYPCRKDIFEASYDRVGAE